MKIILLSNIKALIINSSGFTLTGKQKHVNLTLFIKISEKISKLFTYIFRYLTCAQLAKNIVYCYDYFNDDTTCE